VALAVGVGVHMRAIRAAIDAKIYPETTPLVYARLRAAYIPSSREYAKYWPNRLPEI